ncbi:acyltransferase family protein [Erwinia rhapontici]|uniref:acyltransferase family protein n=1 Tax=Erwinia rhapontici TaxID=55212 RepID=UPI00133136AF|nr:acyltransferase [Erwinia rhapontici]MBP2156849.1 peptidoglycan/LPS O-acetylase OafA/YrhL [Erwinia rhapontici]
MTQKNNCFDIVRHLAAFMVIFSHHYAFNGLAEPKVLGATKLGTFAVLIFFSISGYLITGSLIKSTGLKSYIHKRAMRIMPGLITCAFFMTYILCPFFGSGDGFEFILSKDSFFTFLDLSTFGWHPDEINGFASSYIHKNALNGSLWTLGFEVLSYALITIIIFKRDSAIEITISLILISIITQVAVKAGLIDRVGFDINRASLLLSVFFIGGFLYLTKDHWNSTILKTMMVVISTFLLVFVCNKSEQSISFYACIPFIIIPLCNLFSDNIIKGRFDISYGMYIYAYPTQQILSNNYNLTFWSSLTISIIIIIIISTLSWLLVEKRFIRR